jgi:hypothetical protein
MAFPSQNQESFFYGHVQAFQHCGGVPWRISYDNLTTAVRLVLQGRVRRAQRAFVSFRSYYLFESHFCTPGQGHEKGGVEGSVGCSRRNFMVPLPEVSGFEDLNRLLLAACLKDDQRRLSRQPTTIGQAWENERAYLRSLPAFAYEWCAPTSARLNPYSMIVSETNRYSVPVNRARRDIVVKAYPFHLELFEQTTLLARHARCYEREQDIFEPLHYLPLLQQRPGAFDYAKPLRRWRESWPQSDQRMLQVLRDKWPEGRGVQEFIRILRLHEDHPAALIQQAIEQARSYGCVHRDGVLHCVHQLQRQNLPIPSSLDLSDRPQLQAIGLHPIDLRHYVQVLPSSG